MLNQNIIGDPKGRFLAIAKVQSWEDVGAIYEEIYSVKGRFYATKHDTIRLLDNKTLQLTEHSFKSS